MTNLSKVIPEIIFIENLLFKKCNLELSNVFKELESREYLAHTFKLNSLNIKFRKAKITPTKTGQFVSIWKRNEIGITVPHSISDDFYFYIIAVQKQIEFGVFIFPKKVLHQNKILSDDFKEGKRGIRVYPNWDLTTNKQAEKTQLWQSKYFFNLNNESEINLLKFKNLLIED